jgi:chromate transporter
MGAVAAGLVTATGLKLASTLRKHPLGMPLSIALTVACFVSVALLKLPLVYVLFALGALACVLTYRKLSGAA